MSCMMHLVLANIQLLIVYEYSDHYLLFTQGRAADSVY